jgi:membrane associated rhomboid family serine protease
VFGHLLLFVAIVQAATLVRALRGDGSIQRGYAFVVGGVLGLAVLAMGQEERFLGIIAIALCALTVIIPGALALLSKRAFRRGRFASVAVLSHLRATLMPGAGLSRQLPVVDGLAVLERDGVDAALEHFREIVKEAAEHDDTGNLAMAQEQIISMLFYDQRWDEGITYYERCFHPGYAVLRPALALSLLRAFGESGRLHRAAGLLRAMEEGPLGSDPRTAELLGQARLTFLAYAGEATSVTENLYRVLGVSTAAVTLFHGIALREAGEGEAARRTLQSVGELARRKDKQVVNASQAALDELAAASSGVWEAASEIEPELRKYSQGVARRLFAFVGAAPATLGRRRTWMTYAIVVLLGAIFGVATLRGGGGAGLLELGALTPELWHEGARWRVLTAPWVHLDLIGLLLDVYAVWIAGQVVERRFGWARMGLSTIGGATGGLFGAMLIAPELVPGMVGTNLFAVAAIATALWSLLPSRTPQLAPRTRRNLAITLTLIFLANLLATLPGPYGQGSSPVALLCAIVVSTGVAVGLPSRNPKWLRRGVSGALVTLLLGSGGAAALVASEDATATLMSHAGKRCEQAGVALVLPPQFMVVDANAEVPTPVPIVDGFLDTLELGAGSLVQVVVVEGTHADLESAWFAVAPQQADALGTAPAEAGASELEALIAEDSRAFRVVDLLENGEVVGRVIERRVGEGDGASTVMLVATPPSALEHSAPYYAAVIREAELGAAAPAEDGPGCAR